MKKVNLFDAFVFGTLILLISIALLGYLKPKPVCTKDIYLKARVTDNASDIKNEVQGQIGKRVYFDGSNNPVTLESESSTGGNLYLIIKGKGEVKDLSYTFNGISVSTGQKAEIHSNFKAQVIITDIQNEPFKGN